jgi:hypothetical protein
VEDPAKLAAIAAVLQSLGLAVRQPLGAR